MQEKLRVWHNTNMTESVYHPVKGIEQAKKLINRLIRNDNKDDGVFSNAFGLEIYDESIGALAWSEWYSDEGSDIMELIEEDDNKITCIPL